MPTTIALQRLYQQQLIARPFATPEAVVSWFGAVQSQDYPGAKWSLGMRMQHATDDLVDQAFNAGRILRTHVMRPTWHFVTPEDIRWILELTAPRVHALNAYMYRQCELDATLLARTSDLITRMLQGGNYLTRAEIGAKLAEAGIQADGFRLGYIVHYAELEALICSGPRRGKQFTYALLEERAPQAKRLERDAALAELVRRYYIGHGPATLHDFARWSGLTVADARAGVEMNTAHLQHEEIEGQTYWFGDLLPIEQPTQQAFLLPTYDEFLVGFTWFDKLRHEEGNPGDTPAFFPLVVIEGKIVASWRRTLKTREVVIELQPLIPLTAAHHQAIEAEMQRYAAFIGLPVRSMAI